MAPKTYRAAVKIASTVRIVILSVLVRTRVADTIARESNDEVELRIRVSWLVLQETSVAHVREDIIERGPDVDRSPIARVTLAVAPRASLSL